MTVSSSTNKVSFNGDGSTTVFAYSFKVFDESDLTVILRASDGTETTQTITTNYTVSGVGDAGGGNVTMVTAPASGEQLTILREQPLTQGLDLVPNDPFPANSIEDSLDKLTFMVQQHEEELGRAIKASRTNTLTGSEFTISAADRANKVFSFDGSGDLAVTQELGVWQGDWATATTFSVRDIVKDASNSNVYICITAHTSSGSTPISSNTDSAKWALLVDAASAATSATNAAASETAAQTAQTAAEAAQTAAETAQTAAETAETNAETAETNAETAQAAAEAAQAAAELVYDNFDDRYLGAKATDPTLDNDGDALIDGALYFDTTNNVMKVYDLGGTAWKRTTPTSAEQTNIDTVSGISANVTTVAGISGDVTTVSGISADVTTVANNDANVTTVATNNANVTTVAGISSNVTTVAGISSDVTTVAADGTDIGTVATNIANVNTVAGISANVTTVAGISTDVSAVVADEADIGVVSTNIADVNTAATNITEIQNASTNAATATTKAAEASTSASNAATSETNASTSATNASTSAVNAATSETNAATSASSAATSSSDAESARDQAQSARDTAELHKTAAETAATSATNTAAALTGFDLAAISESKSVTAVDVFVYDTSKDSDGGAWRKRTQGTSWYNETLNTSTRGSRREFPAVAVIVAEATKVTIYDGDDPSLPMWRVALTGLANLTSVSALNGQVYVGRDNGADRHLYFIEDKAKQRWETSALNGYMAENLANYFGSGTLIGGDTDVLVDGTTNDVAMTVLPNAPIDAATGLPVPTIAVATDGGTSVIRDDGTVVDSAVTLSQDFCNFVQDGLWYQRTTGAVYFSTYTDIAAGDGFGDQIFAATVGNSDVDTLAGGSAMVGVGTDLALGGSTSTGGAVSGLMLHKPNYNDQTQGMSALTTSTYNTGWMNGDIKGAFLSDTDDTDLTAPELVDTTVGPVGSTYVSRGTLTDAGGGYWQLTGNDPIVSKTASVNGLLTVGKSYVVTLDVTSISGTLDIHQSNAQNVGVTFPAFFSTTTTGVFTKVIVAEQDSLTIFGPTSGLSSTFKVSVTEADEDRSVNDNGLIVNGTITRSPVATGADLVAYSGFSGSNYLEQPYNSDLDFGTGDFSIMGWFNLPKVYATIMSRGNNIEGAWFLYSHAAGVLRFYWHDGSSYVYGAQTSSNVIWDNFAFLVIKKENGVLSILQNNNTLAQFAHADTLTCPDAILRIGANGSLSQGATNSKIALLRISATAPTADQIAKIYEDEKVLFQENAEATLYGSSDAVTALAHDPDTGLLHVGTSAGRSVFQGLRRVSNTTTAVGTAISASNNLIVEE